jgi:DNA helicase-2/ATP-dependent DNA helicase PcrA
MDRGAFAARLLNPAQLEAVEAPSDTALIVLAAPGSGKTLTLVHRVGRLLQVGVPMSGVLALTFTRKAAEEMQGRLKMYFKASGCSVSTFHSFALTLLRKYPEAVGLRPYFSIVGRARQIEILTQCLADTQVPEATSALGSEDLEGYYELVGGAIEVSERGVPKAESGLIKGVLSCIFSIKTNNEAGLSTMSPSFQALYTAYQGKLREANNIDMNDILLLACKLLEHSEILEEIQGLYTHVLCDEFQDTNEQQLTILHKIKPHGCLTVVGDDDQAIYSWRGASDRAFKRFEELYPSAVRVVLTQNYRSTQTIVDLAGSLISHNTTRFPKTVQTDNPPGPLTQLVYCRNPKDEAKALVTMLLQFKADMDLDWKDCAVLYRVRAVGKEIKLQFKDQGVPVEEYGREELIDVTVKLVLAYLRLALDLDDDEAFLAVFNKAGRALNRHVLARLQETAKSRGSSLFIACKAMSMQGCDKVSDALSELMLGVAHVHTCAARYQTSALIELILKKAKHKKTRKVDDLISRARGLEGLVGVGSLMKDLAYNTSYVHVSTIHQSKGLEWALVFLSCFNEKVLPLPPASLSMLEEERRLAYVAMTRARQQLVVTLVESDSWGELQCPSRFTVELDSSLIVPTTSTPKRKHSPQPGFRRLTIAH